MRALRSKLSYSKLSGFRRKIMDKGFFFDVTLPYSLQIPVGECITFTHDGITGLFVHIEKINTSVEKGVTYSPDMHIPADKYGVFFKSKVRIVLNEESVSAIHLIEEIKTQKTFSELSRYVNLCFGLHGTKLKPFVVGAINKILGVYRVISQEWHASPVTAKDLTNYSTFSYCDEKVQFLSVMPDAHRIFSGKSKLFGGVQLDILKKAAMFEGTMAPLQVLEADIHDKATQSEFLTAGVLIALLSEEAIKEHIIQYLSKYDNTLPNVARLKLIKPNGHYLGISELVDKPRKNRECFIEKSIGWKPYQSKEYTLWNNNVRELRNNIIHASEKSIEYIQIIEAWSACTEFLGLSRKMFIEKLISERLKISHLEFMRFYVPLSNNVFTDNLIGSFTET